MLQGAPQFTPQQLLDAGRRAEAEGKLDLAVQFYRHLTDHYAPTSEAAEARNGLGRIGGRSQPIWHGDGGAMPAHNGDGRAHHARAHRRHVPHRDHYRTGRALAVLFSAIGWLSIVAATVVLAAGAGAQLLHVEALKQLDVGAGVLMQMPGAILVGAVLVFLGQAGRALFDQANATRELVALERARTGIDPP
ncbi:MAG: hypothetical protein F9K29_03805 [Hyphomicrobiaceae bacterium]|nr:MAG: hypothetical protein F9K29_03805 [Hyphomicrobiaceae bacterium]